MAEYSDADIFNDLGLGQRVNEMVRPHTERTATLFKELGHFALDALDGLREHPVLSTEIGGLSFAGGVAISGLIFSRRR